MGLSFLNFKHALESSDGLIKTQILRPDPRVSISEGLSGDMHLYMFSGDADAAGLGNVHWRNHCCGVHS